jgi:hypothetical protein
MISGIIIDNRKVRHRHVINRYSDSMESLVVGGMVTFEKAQVKCAVLLLIDDVFITV